MAENSISWKICSTRTPNEPQFEFSKLSSNFEGCHLAVRRCNWSKAANCYSFFLTTGQRSLSSQWGKLISYYFTLLAIKYLNSKGLCISWLVSDSLLGKLHYCITWRGGGGVFSRETQILYYRLPKKWYISRIAFLENKSFSIKDPQKTNKW